MWCVYLQITGETVGEVKAVADMHQRKAEMAKHSDAFIALPGLFSLSFSKILAPFLTTLFSLRTPLVGLH